MDTDIDTFVSKPTNKNWSPEVEDTLKAILEGLSENGFKRTFREILEFIEQKHDVTTSETTVRRKTMRNYPNLYKKIWHG